MLGAGSRRSSLGQQQRVPDDRTCWLLRLCRGTIRWWRLAKQRYRQVLMVVGDEYTTCLMNEPFTIPGGVCIFKVFIEYPLNLRSGHISMFSVNQIFDRTLIMQFCYFSRKNRNFLVLGYKCVSIQNSTWVLLVYTQLTVSVALYHHSWMHAGILLESISNFQ